MTPTAPTHTPAHADPMLHRYNRPWLFYGLATLIPWALWCIAGWLSHQPQQSHATQSWTAALALLGLATPAFVAFWLLRGQPDLLRDARQRLLWPRNTQPLYLWLSALLLPASILAAMGLSLLLGYSAEQFQLRGGFSFTSGLVPVWLIMILAPVLEELAWHSYGTDSLLARMSVFAASMLFTVIWTLWHLPLSFIKGYYHAELVDSGWLHTLNFPLSMIPFVLLMNWLYLRTGRSITVAIIFHASAGYANEMFMTHPDAKLIQTALLLPLTAWLLWRDRALFFSPPRPAARPQVAY